MTNPAKTYPAPWQGQLVLACRKCQKKLKGDPGLQALYKLRKAVKRHNKSHPDRTLHVLNVPCMDLCPKNGITVCNVARQPPRLSILREESEIEGVFERL